MVEVPSIRYSLPAVYLVVRGPRESFLTGIETCVGSLFVAVAPVPLTATTETTAGAFCAPFGRFASVYLDTSCGVSFTVGLAVVPLVIVTCGPLTYVHSKLVALVVALASRTTESPSAVAATGATVTAGAVPAAGPPAGQGPTTPLMSQTGSTAGPAGTGGSPGGVTPPPMICVEAVPLFVPSVTVTVAGAATVLMSIAPLVSVATLGSYPET